MSKDADANDAFATDVDTEVDAPAPEDVETDVPFELIGELPTVADACADIPAAMTLEEYVVRMTTASCERYQRCDSFLPWSYLSVPLTREACIDVFTEVTLRDLERDRRAWELGWIAFDSVGAAEDVRQMCAAECRYQNYSYLVLLDALEARGMGGTREQGESCYEGSHCASGRCTTQDQCPGTCIGCADCTDDEYCDDTIMCAPRAVEGALCEETPCVPDLACLPPADGSAGSLTCQPYGSAGQPCSGSGACKTGFYCDETQLPAVCAPRLGIAGACGGAVPCHDELVCASWQASPTCVAQGVDGSRCTTQDDCQDELRCLDTSGVLTCRAPREGDACQYRDDCGPFDYGTDLFCDGLIAGSQPGVCVTMRHLQPGEACTLDLDKCAWPTVCLPNLEGTGGICREPGAPGEPCAGQDCLERGTCFEGVCVHRGDAGEACTRDVECLEYCGPDGLCAHWVEPGERCPPDPACEGQPVCFWPSACREACVLEADSGVMTCSGEPSPPPPESCEGP